MANTTVDTLEVRITANAKSAADSLNSLARALGKVKTALTGVDKDGLRVSERMAKSLNEMSGAINSITTGSIKRLQKLSNALNDYADACKGIKAAGDVSRQLKNVMKTLDGATGKGGAASTTGTALTRYVEQSTAMANAVQSSTALVALGGGSKGGMDMSDAIDTMERVTDEGQAAKVRMSLGLWVKFRHAMKEFGAKTEDALTKIRDRLKDFNFHIKRSTGFFNKFLHSIGRIMLYRMIRSAIKAVSEAFSEGLKNAYMFSQQDENFTRLADTMDHLKSVTSQMMNQLGAFYGEFIQFIKPALDWLIEKVRQLAQFLTELFAALNGQNEYQFALLEDLKWQEATDSLKAYKHQLLGLDELNNLTKNNSSKKEEEDYSKKFEILPVRESLQQIGQGWQEIKKKLDDAFNSVYASLLIPTAMAAIGAILLFTGHPLVGIGLILYGAKKTYDEYKQNWSDDESQQKIQEFLKKYKDLFKVGSDLCIAIGTMLLFVPGHRALGLGLIYAGIKLKQFAKGDIKFKWGEFLSGKFEPYRELIKKTTTPALAIGTMLLFVPGMRGLGLGIIAASLALDSLADQKYDFNWTGLLKTILDKFEDYKKAFVRGSAAITALGAILLFVPGMHGIGLKLIKMGMPGLFMGALSTDWESVLNKLKEAWRAIENWIDEYVIIPLQEKWYALEKLFHRDLNDDGSVGWPTVKEAVSVGTKQLDDLDKYFGGTGGTKGGSSANVQEFFDAVQNGEELSASDYKALAESYGINPETSAFKAFFKSLGTSIKENLLNNILSYLPVTLFKAGGGPVARGNLFYAGEAGPEFVGSMGNSSAVANTQQMTDAIYKAAYMGMSKALAENGGNGLAGFVPATTDDLFIAMRKKASNYNKVTGSSAFA